MSFVLPAAVAVPLTVTATALAQQPDNNPGGDKGGQGRTSASPPRPAC